MLFRVYIVVLFLIIVFILQNIYAVDKFSRRPIRFKYLLDDQEISATKHDHSKYFSKRLGLNSTTISFFEFL